MKKARSAAFLRRPLLVAALAVDQETGEENPGSPRASGLCYRRCVERRLNRYCRARAGALLSAIVTATFLGCGGDSESSCGRVEPCGGDAVGTWSIVGSCGFGGGSDFAVVQQEFFARFCRGVNMSAAVGDIQTPGETVAGYWSFSSGMELEYSYVETQHMSFLCGDGEACSDLDIQIQAAQAMYPIQSGSCTTGGPGSCECTMVWSQIGQGAGTYTNNGTQLLLDAAGYPQTAFNYCIQGNTMHVITQAGVAGGPNSDIVAERQ